MEPLQRIPGRSASSDWRAPRAAVDLQQQQQQQQQFLAQQQSNMYQYQMALQALNLQTMEMQERLIAQMNQTTLQNDAMQEEADMLRQRRSAALSNLHRAQQSRASPEPEVPPTARSNRLSFNGAETFLEQAVARRTAQTPPEQPMHARGHTRSASSTSSTQSAMLSEFNKRMTSPSTGLTLVLSQPGDSFPSPTVPAGKRLTLRMDRASPAGESDSSSSSPRTPPSEGNSEVYSFESVTSVHTEEGKEPVTRLNPAAPAFTPVPAYAPIRQASGPFSLPRPASPAAKPVRQPKGPCPDEQLATLNFAGRARSRAFSQMRSKLRATSPVQNFMPIAT